VDSTPSIDVRSSTKRCTSPKTLRLFLILIVLVSSIIYLSKHVMNIC